MIPGDLLVEEVHLFALVGRQTPLTGGVNADNDKRGKLW
jgi:hypothetical protein